MAASCPVSELFLQYRASGDPNALAKAFEAVAPELYRIALSRVQDAELAQDAIQETFVKAIERSQSFDASRPLRPWLSSILLNEIRTVRWHARKLPPAEDDCALVSDPGASPPAVAAEHRELRTRLESELARMPAAYRTVVHLSVQHGMTAAEIARSLGRSEGTVRKQIQRGRRWLRRSLSGFLGALVALLGTGCRSRRRRTVMLSAAAIGCALPLAWLASPSWQSPKPIGAPSSTATASSRFAPAVGMNPARAPERSTVEPPSRVATNRTARVRYADGSPGSDLGLTVRPSKLTDADLYERRFRTDEHGRVRDLPDGDLEVVLDHGAHTHLDAGHSTAPISIAAGFQVVGRVVDAADVPVANARILVDDRRDPTKLLAITRSAPDGSFAVRDLGGPRQVLARSEFACTKYAHDVNPGTDHWRLTLRLTRPSGVLRGVVFDRQHRQVSGARVDVWVKQTDRCRGSSREAVFSDASGHFEIGGVPAGHVTVEVRAVGMAVESRQIRVRPSEATDCTFVLGPGQTCTGRVTDSDGSAIAGAWVGVRAERGRGGRGALSDTDGRYELDGLRTGAVLLAKAPGHGEAESMPGADSWDPVLVPEEAPILGQIVGREQLAGATLRFARVAFATDGRPRIEERTAVVDGAGRFQVSGIDKPGFAACLSPRDGPFSWHLDPRRVTRSPTGIEIRLTAFDLPEAVIHAVLHDETGRTIPFAHATLVAKNSPSGMPVQFDRNGKLIVESVPHGTYALEIRDAHGVRRTRMRAADSAGLLDFGHLVSGPEGLRNSPDFSARAGDAALRRE